MIKCDYMRAALAKQGIILAFIPCGLKTMSLTDGVIRRAKPLQVVDQKTGLPVLKARKMVDEKGLYLHVLPSGSKVWRYAYSLNNKAGLYTVGPYQPGVAGHISIDAARVIRAECRALVVSGVHPKAERDQQRAVKRAEADNTFRAVAIEWLAWKKREVKPKSHADMERVLTEYVIPKIGAMPIADIKSWHIRDVMESVAERGIIGTALIVRRLCSGVLCFDMSRSGGTTKGDVTTALHGKNFRYRKPRTKHKARLSKDEIGPYRQNLRDSALSPKTKLALELLLFVFTRPSELRTARWTDFDMERATWKFHLTKRAKEHMVPLSRQALELLHELHKLTGDGALLFPGIRDPKKPMSDSTLRGALRRIGYAGRFSPHSARAQFSTEANELNYNRDSVELQLSHSDEDKVRGAYNAAERWPDRRAMVQSYADCIDAWSRGDGGNVIPLNRAA